MQNRLEPDTLSDENLHWETLPPPIDLSIVIVNWNVREMLRNCLRSLEPTMQSLRTEILVVDNASHDGSAEMVAEEFPQVRLFACRENLGFPRANNLAIPAAKGKYILLLNPDTIVEPDTLTACCAKMDGEESIGALGCRILYPDGRIQLECARRLPSLFDVVIESFYLHMLFPKNRFFGRKLMGDWDHQSDREVECLSGAFLMLRHQVLDSVGLLDERFFMYYEDIDLCARIAENGWRLYYLAKPTIIHYSGESRSQSDQPFDWLGPEIVYTFFLRHKSPLHAAIYRILVGFQSMIRMVVSFVAFSFLRLFRRQFTFRTALNFQTQSKRLAWALRTESSRRELSTLMASDIP